MGHIFLSFLFFNVLLLNVYKHYKAGDCYISKSNLILYTLLLIAFGTYGTGEGDYLHYGEVVPVFKSLSDVYFYNGMEIQYNYLAYILGGNYILWRFVIFSIQFVGLSYFLYKAKLNTYPVLLCIITICLVLYTYQRSYWGVMFYFMGLYLLLEKKNPLFLMAIASCYFAHTQNIVLLVLFPLGFLNIKSWHLLLVIVLLGVITTLFKDGFVNLVDSGGVEDYDYFNSKIQTYGSEGKGYFGDSIGEKAVFTLRYVPLVLISALWLRMIVEKSIILTFQKPYRGVINVAIGTVFVSLVFLFTAVGSSTFFYRILSMALFPISIVLPYMVENNSLKRNVFIKYIWIYIICSELSYVKDLYYAYSAGL